ncbi:MAG: ABC transporter ATP-binding protein [Pseudomonadota bacterium]
MKVLLRLLPFIQKHAWAFWGGMFGLLIARVFEALIPLFVKEGVDAISAAQAARGNADFDATIWTDALVWPAIAIALCVIAQIIVTIISRILIRRIGVYAAFDLRNRVYGHLQKQGPIFFSHFSVGDLMARAINDILLVREFIAGTIRTTLVLIFAATIGLSFMFSLSWQLTLAVLLPAPLITFFAYAYSKRIYRQSQSVQEGFSELSTFVQENLNGIRTVQAMAQEQGEIKRFTEVNTDFAGRNLRLFTTSSQLGAIMPVLAAISTIIIVGYGTMLLQSGAITLGTFAAFFSYLTLLLWPVREAGSLVTQWQRGASGAARLFELLDYEPEIKDNPTPNHPSLTGSIKIEGLDYRYENKDKFALQDINLDIQPGQTVAILGRVGSGKSTLLRLLVRLLKPTEGTILLDEHPIEDFPLAYLREQVCLVLQDPFLFANSIGENIAYDDPERQMDEILKSAEVAALRSTIDEFPEGIHTELGERGVTLSGGQKQRTALARGLVRMTPLLILDDCFSAVDTETEEHILAGLKEVRKGLTTMLVSNRVSTARHADEIIVLDEGRIIERGSHMALLEQGGFYAELEKKQRISESLKGELAEMNDE